MKTEKFVKVIPYSSDPEFCWHESIDGHYQIVKYEIGRLTEYHRMNFKPIASGYFAAYYKLENGLFGNYIDPAVPYYRTMKDAQKACISHQHKEITP